MNRAFLMIVAPALLVALVYLGFGWGLRVAWPVGVVLLAVGGVALLWRRKRT